MVVGGLIGLATAGPFSDWVSARATARNSGIREPEMRLPALIPYVLIMALGQIITGVGYQYKWPWPVIVVLGYTCSGIQMAGLPSISSTYGVDSYKPAAGSLFVAITVNKNLWGYGMGKFITEWTEANGYVAPVVLLLLLGCCLLIAVAGLSPSSWSTWPSPRSGVSLGWSFISTARPLGAGPGTVTCIVWRFSAWALGNPVTWTVAVVLAVCWALYSCVDIAWMWYFVSNSRIIRRKNKNCVYREPPVSHYTIMPKP